MRKLTDLPDSKHYRLDLALLAVAFVWGSTFALVKMTLLEVPVFWFLFLRFILAFVFFLPLLIKRFKLIDREIAFWGLVLGIILFAGYAFQTIGLKYTTSANAGFVTGLFVVFTPLICAAIFRWLPHWSSIVGVVLAFVGLAFLSLGNRFQVNWGDLLVLACAFAYALYIALVGRFTTRFDPALLTWLQTIVVAVLSLTVSLSVESSHLWPVKAISLWTLFITSLFATVIAFWIQIYAQRFLHPTRIALILLAEPVFAGVFGYILLSEVFTFRKFIGAGLILGGMAFSEIFSDSGKKT